MGNRKPCSFTLVSFKLTAPRRAPHFVPLSCTSLLFSDVGSSLQFPSACFLTSTGGIQRHKLRSRTSCNAPKEMNSTTGYHIRATIQLPIPAG